MKVLVKINRTQQLARKPVWLEQHIIVLTVVLCAILSLTKGLQVFISIPASLIILPIYAIAQRDAGKSISLKRGAIVKVASLISLISLLCLYLFFVGYDGNGLALFFGFVWLEQSHNFVIVSQAIALASLNVFLLSTAITAGIIELNSDKHY